MSTARLSGLDLGETRRTGDSSLRSGLGTTSGLLGSALLALCLYAAFAHGAVEPALAGALLASRLDPLSDAGLLAAATIEIHIGNPEQSRRDLFGALGRQPTDGEASQRLATEDLALGDIPDALVAARRARALDPYGPSARALARQVESLLAREPS